MNCNKIENLLSAYVDQELPGREMLAIRQHLRTCEDCRSAEQSIRDIKRVFSSALTVEPTRGFEERLALAVLSGQSTTSAHRTRQFNRPKIQVWYAASGIAAVILIPLLLISSAKLNGHFVEPTRKDSSVKVASNSTPTPVTSEVRIGLPDQKSKTSIGTFDDDRVFYESGDPIQEPDTTVALLRR